MLAKSSNTMPTVATTTSRMSKVFLSQHKIDWPAIDTVRLGETIGSAANISTMITSSALACVMSLLFSEL